MRMQPRISEVLEVPFIKGPNDSKISETAWIGGVLRYNKLSIDSLRLGVKHSIISRRLLW